MTYLAELLAAIDSTVTSFRTDIKHDIDFITANPLTPFLHFAGEYGTQIQPLWLYPQLPKKGEFTPYLFSQATRETIVENIPTFVAAVLKNPQWSKIIHYFDGDSLRKITSPQALTIAHDYKTSMLFTFKKEEKRYA